MELPQVAIGAARRNVVLARAVRSQPTTGAWGGSIDRKVTTMTDAIEERRNPYLTFSLPTDPQLICDCQLIQGSALKLREFLRNVPDARHRREAMLMVDRAVMVAMGGYHTKAADEQVEARKATEGK